MATDTDTKARNFRALHERDGAFVIPNPWDVGTARILASMGFEALATTSAGFAFSLGLPDGAVSRDQALAHCRDIVTATDLPVSADLEGGFVDDPADVAETIRLAADTGLAGCSIEDATGQRDAPIYDFEMAVERIAAAVEAARGLPRDFVLTARAENHLHGQGDLDDTIRRLQAFEAAGADVVYAPGLPDLDAIRAVCSSVGRPVNVETEAPNMPYGIAELAEAGVKRISVGAAFSRLALGAVMRAAAEMRDEGTFSFTNDAVDFHDLQRIFRAYSD